MPKKRLTKKIEMPKNEQVQKSGTVLKVPIKGLDKEIEMPKTKQAQKSDTGKTEVNYKPFLIIRVNIFYE